MKLWTLLVGLFAFCHTASSGPSSQIEEGDASVLLALKTFAPNVVVELGDEDASDSISKDDLKRLGDDLKRLEHETSDFASNEAGDADTKKLNKLEEEGSHLGNSLEQKDVAEPSFLQVVRMRAEAYWGKYLDSACSKIGEVGIGLTLLLTLTGIGLMLSTDLRGNMQKGQRGAYKQFDIAEQCDVWEHRAVECPHKASEARITRITMLFHEIRGPSAEESITVSDLHDLMRDPRLANEFADIGMHNFHDAMYAYKVLAHKSSDGMSVNLMEFVSVSTSPEGQLLQLLTELDEGNECEDSPPGFFNEEDLCHMMKEPRVKAKFTSLGVSPEDAFTVFRAIEAQSGHGLVANEEFVSGCTKITIKA